ncbi:beta-glucosidase 12 [Ricinus communis]|uniref:Beta-glucosidase, putative n=1 Tax=Ricinus communis TaxID=3988 RepID=B9REG9_RICCO|nr:beta-glucosidase 12 [Ricinus communis]EEF50172.1 beta-glucosidase, putative [Ricinus communis]|eukprot:XP_002512138.1 beta-glucosidase 12 [Ricinus communis]
MANDLGSSTAIGILILSNLLAITELVSASTFNRSSFPAGFLFGTAAASYQYEGAVNEDGKGLSIWDTFTHKYPERIAGGANADVAVDFYHRYQEDVNIMKNMGLDTFRFSISWSRVLPNGTVKGGVNKKGIDFYNNLINELLSQGIQPFVTLFHWDLPQALEDEYGGFLSPSIVHDFKNYAELCFKEFGDRVKHWITLNEPWSYSNTGYNMGLFAPGRCSKFMNAACQAGDSATEPYLVGHHMLLSHAAAVKLYKEKYQASQKGQIGITLVCHWMVPFSKTKPDHQASKRALDFMYGWYMHPLVYGDYPKSMINLVGNRLPRFTTDQSMMVKGSFDFIGLNYYSSFYAYSVPATSNSVNISYSTDSLTNLTTERDGIPIGPTDGSIWIHVYPRGLRDVLMYTKKKYNNPTIYITENGIDQLDNGTSTLTELVNDLNRIDYYKRHLASLERAIKEGVDVKGYFAWSLLDNFEWAAAYTMRYGINVVDYKNGLKRYPKKSAIWFNNFLQK